ncbi:MAG: Mannose-6-phosphate isomerase ManA [Phycisphaerae bacterium]|nr:Mannose-6-phosphate isomerase ManA [Phycisphaerae bacterium]
MLYPLKFEPIFKHRIWGGRRIGELFDKPLPADQPIGESWELSGLPGDESVVANGLLAGQKLTDLLARFGAELIGHAGLIDGQFPLLIKLLDARQNLSVQVHPGPEMVARSGGKARLKNEAWIVLDADPGAKIYIGLAPGVTRDRFARGLREGGLADLMRAQPAKPGHAFYLPAGTVHALGAGLVVAEVQTPSDTTYRVWDWDRVDPATGKGRQLHVAEAMEAINFSDPPPRPSRSHVASVFTTVTQLVKCENFTVERVRFTEGVEQEIPYAEMVVWQVLTGQGEVRHDGGEPVPFRAGDLVLLPASLRGGRVFCQTDCTWLEVTVPAVAPAPAPDPRRLPVVE